MFFFFFFNDTATTEIYTLSLHDALPIFGRGAESFAAGVKRGEILGHAGFPQSMWVVAAAIGLTLDRKSTRLNSSHLVISYAVFCLKKKKKQKKTIVSTRTQYSNKPLTKI